MTNTDRQLTILHVDMDAFFASVEALDNPALRGIPLIVGGSGQRGVVASCSYQARFYGVRSAMSSVEARRLCPQATFIEGDYARYVFFSRRLRTILTDFTPLVEALSIDEAFLDVSGATKLFGDAETIAHKIRARVRDELGLTCSVGVATTKHVAKLASKAAKPTASRSGAVEGPGVVVVPECDAVAFLHALPVRALWGVGPATEARLARLGLTTVAQLSVVPLDVLERSLGHAAATRLSDLCWNRDDRDVVPDRVAQSIGHERTFPNDIFEEQAIHGHLLRLSEKTAKRLRKAGVEAKTFTLKVRFGDFATVSRSTTLQQSTDSARDVFETAKRLAKHVHFDAGVRLLGISASGLCDAASDLVREGLIDLRESATLQPELFDVEIPESSRRLDLVMDEINDRFGESTLGRATFLSEEITEVVAGESRWGPNA